MFARVNATNTAPLRMFKNDLFEETPGQGDILGRLTANTVDATATEERVGAQTMPASTLQSRLEAQRLKQQQARKQRIQGQTVNVTDTDLGGETVGRASNSSLGALGTATQENAPSASTSAPSARLTRQDDSDDDDIEVTVLEDKPSTRQSSKRRDGAKAAAASTTFAASPRAATSPREEPAAATKSSDSAPRDSPRPERPASAQPAADAPESGASGPAEGVSPTSEEEPATAVSDTMISVPDGPRANHALEPDTLPQHDRMLQSLISNRKVFTMTPGPLVSPMQCYIVREKGTGGMLAKTSTQYKLYMEETHEFLLAAVRRKRTKTASYIISLDQDDLGRDSENYFGKTKSNFLGTEFWIYDNKERPGRKLGPRMRSLHASRSLSSSDASGNVAKSDDIDDDEELDSGRMELGVVAYQMNVMGTNGPRKMCVGIPAVDLDTQMPAVWRPTKPSESMMAHLKEPTDNMIFLENKSPKWNASLGAYCLNFGGRVTQASVKNFQLVAAGDHDREVLQFGRVGKNTFSMDYRWPISAFQAMCICITSLDNKLACE